MNTSKKMQGPKTAFYILLVYIVFQLSGFLLRIPSLTNALLLPFEGYGDYAIIALVAWWNSITSIIAIIVCFLLINKNKLFWNVFKGEKASIAVSIGWGILGYFLVYFGQTIGAAIEYSLGIETSSENTKTILKIIEIAPIMTLVTVLGAPILEELVFRRVIFGSLIQVQSFWVSALLSAFVFAAFHLDFSHIILYTISGFILAFLYYKTKRLLTPIIAHMMLNGSITVYQFYGEKIQQFIDQLPK